MSASPSNIPSNFYTVVNSQLLAQPESQYPLATLAQAALGISLDNSVGAEIAGQSIGAGSGAPYVDPTRDRLRLADDAQLKPFARIFGAKFDMAKRVGDTIQLNRPKWTNSTHSEEARRVKQGQVISTNPIGIEGEQTSLTIARYAGPYSSAASEIRPYVLEKFYENAGVHSQASMVAAHMKRDFDRTLETMITNELVNNASSTVYPEGMSSADSVAIKGQYGLDYETICRVSRTMDEADLPVLPGGKRLFIVTPTGKKQLRQDPEFTNVAKYNMATNPLFPGWFAEDDSFYYIMDNMLPVVANTNSINVHNGLAIAPGISDAEGGPIGFAVAQNPEVRASTNTNYGEAIPLIWMAYFALKCLDNRFIINVKYGQDIS